MWLVDLMRLRVVGRVEMFDTLSHWSLQLELAKKLVTSPPEGADEEARCLIW
jgi:hypothetical protein